MNPITWLKTNLQLAGAIGAAAFFLVTTSMLGVQVLKAHAEIRAGARAFDKLTVAKQQTDRDLATCTSSVTNLEQAQDAQNAAVATMKAQADQKARQAAQAVSQARQEADGYRRQAAAILSAPAPAGDVCKASEALLRQTLEPVR